MKKTISTLFIALLVAGVSTAKAQDKKIKGKKNAVATDVKLDPAATKKATKAVAPAKMNKLVDPADSEAIKTPPTPPAPPAVKTMKKANVTATPKRDLKNATMKKAKAKDIAAPKDKK